MANIDNLRPSEYKLSREEAKKGGKKSGETRRRKAEFRKRFREAMELAADPAVAKSLSKTGIPVETNYDVLIAGIVKGVMKSNPAMAKEALRLIGEDDLTNQKAEMHKIEKAKAELEIERQKLEVEKQRIWLEAVKAQQGQGEELPDDGFLDALKGSAVEDWEHEDI